VEATTIAIACAFGFFASMVDAVAGGGGLISVPALFVLFPSAHPAAILATNKFSSTCGAFAAVIRYAFSGKIIWSVALPAGIVSLGFAFLGARAVSLLPRDLARPLIFVMLLAVAVYTLFNKDLGKVHAPKLEAERALKVAIVMGVVLGFYEGFFGPGTGSFLVFALVGIFGFDMLSASATGRFINFTANISALAYFMLQGMVEYSVALPMAVSTIAGGLVGSKLAITHGSSFIRKAFLIVLIAVLAKFAWDILADLINS
jgi:uncharacterized protein